MPDDPTHHGEDLADLYENAPCGYLSVSPAGRIIKANAAITSWLGHSGDALIGTRLSDTMSIAGRMYWETHLGPLLRMQGFLDGVALDMLTRDGRKMPAFASATERRDAAGGPILTRLAIFKAAERRQYEQGLVSARAAAEQARDESRAHGHIVEEDLRQERALADLREQFMAVLGHDLRNPLAAILAGVRLLGRERLSDRGAQVVPMMHNSAMRMVRLIDNLLDLARGRLGGGLDIQPDATEPLTPVLRHVVDELQTSMPAIRIESAFTIDEPVFCDRSKIAQLVSNLLGNAITHGNVDQPIRIVAHTGEGALEISVTNAGEPIPDAMREKLFQPFFRGDVRASQQGLGLGLYIISEIAKAHGGTIKVTSDALETSFIFRMPLKT